MPTILPENREAVTIFGICRDQVILGLRGFSMGMGGAMFESYVYALDVATTLAVMDRCGVADPILCLEKIQIMFEEYREAIEKKQEEGRGGKAE